MNKPKVLNEQEYSTAMSHVLQELAAVKTVGEAVTRDGLTLCCLRYVTPGSRGNIVILHGFTEFSEKYKEMVWYYRNLGYNVFIYDQRGHGLSARETEDLKLIHVSSFQKYVDDLECVLEQQVKPYGGQLPLVLFGHSMGGAVVTLYMMRHPDGVDKAILSAPMVSPKTKNIPRGLVLYEARRQAKACGWEGRFPHTGEFDPEVRLEKTQDGSPVRFRAAMELRIQTPEYRSSCATNRWMAEAIGVQTALLKRRLLSRVKAKVLILSAGNDRVVKNRLQKRLARGLQTCQFVTVPGAKHNMFFASERILAHYYGAIFDFLQ